MTCKINIFLWKSIVTFATRIWFLYSVYRDVFQDYCLMKKHSHTGYIYMDSHHCVTSYVMWNHCCLMTKALSHWLQEYGVSPVCVNLFLMITVWWKIKVTLATCIWILAIVCPHMPCEIIVVWWKNHCNICYKNEISLQCVFRCFSWLLFDEII